MLPPGALLVAEPNVTVLNAARVAYLHLSGVLQRESLAVESNVAAAAGAVITTPPEASKDGGSRRSAQLPNRIHVSCRRIQSCHHVLRWLVMLMVVLCESSRCTRLLP
jgi:hypothetical protein